MNTVRLDKDQKLITITSDAYDALVLKAEKLMKFRKENEFTLVVEYKTRFGTYIDRVEYVTVVKDSDNSETLALFEELARRAFSRERAQIQSESGILYRRIKSLSRLSRFLLGIGNPEEYNPNATS